ncbi:DUF4231 domain-containing protein [bacterium]|nr:DUF4231 domain-containing protein [bacterium]
MITIGGVLIPVISVLEKFTLFDTYSGIATAIIGAVVAGCAAWEGVANYGEIWRKKRRAAKLVKVEGCQFFQGCGDYQKYGTAIRPFFYTLPRRLKICLNKKVSYGIHFLS